MSIDKNFDEIDLQLKGTTAFAFIFKNGIMIGVDSRESNEWVRTRNETWKPTILNTAEKWFPVTEQIIGIMVGLKKECLKMQAKVTDMVDDLKNKGKKIEVSVAADIVYNYLNGLCNGNNQFGIIIAGYDETKGFQIYRLFLKGNEICKTEVHMLASLGTGSSYSNHNMFHRYNFNLSDDDAKQLAYESVFNSSYFDKNTGGDIHVFHGTEDEWIEEKSVEALQAYSDYYAQYNEDCTLFLVYGDKKPVVTADEMIAHFKPHGDIIVAHRVDHRKSQNQGFYFYRLVFVSKEEALKAFSYVEMNHYPQNSKILSKFPYRVFLKENLPMFVNKASKPLLDFILDESTMVLDYF